MTYLFIGIAVGLFVEYRFQVCQIVIDQIKKLIKK